MASLGPRLPFCRTGSLAIFALIITACGGSPAPPSSPSPITSPPISDGFAGVRYDNLSVQHQFVVGSPTPTGNQTSTYCCWPLPVRNSGSFTFALANFPLNVLPSGGASNVVSDSEMLLLGVNVAPAAGAVTYEWHRAVTQDTVVFTYAAGSSANWSYSFIGHFSWEVNAAGNYYVLVSSPWGNARVDFQVTNSSATAFAIPAGTVGAVGGGGGEGRFPTGSSGRSNGRPRS